MIKQIIVFLLSNIFAGIFAISLILMIIPIAKADYCLDNNTLTTNLTIGSQILFVNQTCNYGCDRSLNICLPQPIILTLSTILIFMAIIIFIVIFVKKIKGR